MYKIESNVPMKIASKSHSTFPFADMEIGESFFLIETSKKSKAAHQRVHNQARTYRANVSTSFRISVRVEAGGYRVWRIA